MSDPVRPAALLPGEVPSRWRLWRSWLLRTFPGRALTLGAAIKAITWPVNLFSTLPPVLEAINMVGSLALLFALAYGITRYAVWAKRRLLWRVRRRLILSYVFVGVVPALLVITFFLLAGLILAFNVSAFSEVGHLDHFNEFPQLLDDLFDDLIVAVRRHRHSRNPILERRSNTQRIN